MKPCLPPPVAKIAELQAIAFEMTKKKLANSDKIKKWLKVLVALGASLGGARPKANIIDEHAHLWIAKFPSADDASYLEPAEFLATFGEPDFLQVDLEELFIRVVFNVATANRDDHLRNHDFIRSPAGWRLAPAFDMNPSFKKDEHVLSLDLYNRQPDFETILKTAGYYRLNKERANAIIRKVSEVVASWQNRARKLGLSKQECLEAEHLFRVEKG